jgi:hypothetical protein
MKQGVFKESPSKRGAYEVFCQKYDDYAFTPSRTGANL